MRYAATDTRQLLPDIDSQIAVDAVNSARSRPRRNLRRKNTGSVQVVPGTSPIRLDFAALGSGQRLSGTARTAAGEDGRRSDESVGGVKWREERGRGEGGGRRRSSATSKACCQKYRAQSLANELSGGDTRIYYSNAIFRYENPSTLFNISDCSESEEEGSVQNAVCILLCNFSTQFRTCYGSPTKGCYGREQVSTPKATPLALDTGGRQRGRGSVAATKVQGKLGQAPGGGAVRSRPLPQTYLYVSASFCTRVPGYPGTPGIFLLHLRVIVKKNATPTRGCQTHTVSPELVLEEGILSQSKGHWRSEPYPGVGRSQGRIQAVKAALQCTLLYHPVHMRIENVFIGRYNREVEEACKPQTLAQSHPKSDADGPKA
eukprot:1506576-Rhodomonas_salina.1